MYRLSNFIFKLRRGISWFAFSFRQNPWQEDYQLFETIEKALLDTARYFEKLEKEEHPACIDRAQIEDIKLAAKLIRMRIDEHYTTEYHDSCPIGFIDGRESVRVDIEKYLLAQEKDDRALRIAMKIIAEKGFHWWV